MAETVADFLIERLMEWGVSRIYGYPGDGINGITAPCATRRLPHISFDQAKAMTRALYRGNPAAPEILRHSFAELVEEYIPHT